jgi:hypothetical protein
VATANPRTRTATAAKRVSMASPVEVGCIVAQPY